MRPTVITSELLAQGEIIRQPVGFEKGYWVGAPGVFYAEDEKALYLTYRIRRPRGVAPDRGGEARIARSTDLRHFEDVWSVTKEQFSTASMERCAIRKGPSGQWHYFTSYVDPADGRWCVSMIKAPRLSDLDAANAERLFSAEPLGLEGIKDPWVLETADGFKMFLSVALQTDRTRKESHDTLDIFNTGECVSATGLATSPDLEHWQWQGVVFEPSGSGWDAYCRRINCVLMGKAFYDGSGSELENYEERTGLADYHDYFGNWESLTVSAPLFASPHASGSLRYLDALIVNGELMMFYEFARPDGAHDLRILKVNEAEAVFRPPPSPDAVTLPNGASGLFDSSGPRP